MAITRLGFEAGANGDAANATNTGFDSIVVTGGTAQISTAWSATGTRSVKFIATSTSGVVYGQKTITATDALYVEGFIYLTGSPSAEVPIVFLGAGATRELTMGLTTSRQLQVRDAGGAGGTILSTSTAIPLTTKVKFCLFATRNATTGTVRAAWSQTSPYSVFDSDSGTLTAKNTGATAWDTIRAGAKVTASANTLDSLSLDDFGWDAGGSGFPIAAPVMSTMQTKTPYVYLNLVGTTFDVGPIAYSASPSTGVVPAATGIFLPTPTTGTTTYTVTATDTGNGGTATLSVDIAAVTSGGVKTRVWSGTSWSDFPNNLLFPDSNLYPDTGRVLGV